MAKNKIELFKKGDVIRTNPADGFYGIAVVLDDGEKQELSPNRWSYPMCHIAITPLLYDFEVTMEDIDISQLRPMKFRRCYSLKNTPEFFKEELLLHIFTVRNVSQLPVIGNIDPSHIYQEELSWKPMPGKFYLCGNTDKWLGREVYIEKIERKRTMELKENSQQMIYQSYLKEKENTIQFNLKASLQFDFQPWIRDELQAMDNPIVKNLLSSVPLESNEGIRSLKEIVLAARPFLSDDLYETIKEGMKEVVSDFKWAHSKEGKLIISIEDWIESARAKVAVEHPDSLIYIGRSFVSPVSLVIGGYAEPGRMEDIKTWFENLMPPIPIQYKILPLHTSELS